MATSLAHTSLTPLIPKFQFEKTIFEYCAHVWPSLSTQQSEHNCVVWVGVPQIDPLGLLLNKNQHKIRG